MNDAERLGAELVMMLRRERDQTVELAATTAKINALIDQVHAAPAGTLYGARTGEQPMVRTDPVEWINGTSPAQVKTRNQAPVPMPRPYRMDHQDGGSTFALTPLGDVVETLTMPAVLQCPRVTGGQCPVDAVHIHTADGVQNVADIGR